MDSRFDLLAKAAAGGETWRELLRQFIPRLPDPGEEGGRAFDNLARAMADEVPRREALRRLGAGLIATFLASLGARPASAACPPGTSPCGRRCVNLQTDRNNCGSCGHECRDDQSCVTGSCSGGAACPTGLTRCKGRCVNLQTDRNNCGACDHECRDGQSCVGGNCSGGSSGGGSICGAYCSGRPARQRESCKAACEECGRDTSRLCPSKTSSSVACCRQGAPCCDGTCCGVGQQCCPGASGSSYCTGLGTNQDCSRCGESCTGGKSCVNMACVCPNGQMDCGDGTCVTLGTNANCSRCGESCTGGKSCVGGACVCPTGQTDCGNGVCVSLGTDLNCRGCGDTCTGGKSCVGGTCTCPSGQADCGTGVCTPLDTTSNCGTCGNICLPGVPCSSVNGTKVCCITERGICLDNSGERILQCCPGLTPFLVAPAGCYCIKLGT
jgi:hypothetical protein